MLGTLAANILVTTSGDECAALLSEASGWSIVYTRPAGREFARHMAVARRSPSPGSRATAHPS